MTVLNGDGLVGRVTTVGPNTATVLLANDPDFTVGTRMEAPTNWASPPARATSRCGSNCSTARRT